MSIGLIGRAIGLFTVTNIDDLLILAVFFGQAVGHTATIRVVAGQLLGFGGILAASVLGALGASLLPEAAVPYLGLLPLILGLIAARKVWRRRRSTGADLENKPPAGPGLLTVAAITLANGGDNVGVYVPVFATSGPSALIIYALVFLALTGVWCAAGHFLATRALIAGALLRWGHVLLPVVLIGIGLTILISGHAFRL